MNPLPGLIILLLGLMMSSHHQSSMVSTMVHKQWGTLLVGYSLARAITYIIFYVSPPASVLPSRPPSELISSFCLISGGLVFMASVSYSLLQCCCQSLTGYRTRIQLRQWRIMDWMLCSFLRSPWGLQRSSWPGPCLSLL